MTHDDLCQTAENWLLRAKGCGFALTELDANIGEIPDSIGFRSGYSIMVECKVSRADFLQDHKKIVRRIDGCGVGKFRFYMCPTDLIKPDEIPQGWGLVYVNEKRKCRQIVGPRGNTWEGQVEFHHERHLGNEAQMMASALRRLKLRGRLHEIYLGPIGAEYKKETT